VLVIDGLRVHRKFSNPLVKTPRNAVILSQKIEQQSINLALDYNRKMYKFEIKRLPTHIIESKSFIRYKDDKIKIQLEKAVNEPWRPFGDSDFETIQFVKK
jgi:hypothetical protein